jgi:hypothetical protein
MKKKKYDQQQALLDGKIAEVEEADFSTAISQKSRPAPVAMTGLLLGIED